MTEHETFESDEEYEDEEELPRPPPRGRGRKSAEPPDHGVDNAADLPLLVHAGTSKSNTVTYLKITRLDGGRGERGIKGKLPPNSTAEDIVRRFGNGTYKVEGCSASHRVLAREESIEISIPGFEDERPQQPVMAGPGPNFALHQMKLVTDMSHRHSETVKDQSAASSEQVREMANKTMEMLTAFTSAQRESERAAYSAAQANQQQFFATMLQMQQTGHAQQMEMLTAMNERSRKSEIDPMAMVQVFLDGIKAAGELGGGEGTEPWLAALREGSGMLGHIAQLANSPAAARLTPPPSPKALPAPGETRDVTRERTRPRKKRLPFDKTEVRELARLKAQLRKRGIPLDAFLSQTREHFETAPDSDLFEGSGDDGSESVGESGDAAGTEHEAT